MRLSEFYDLAHRQPSLEFIDIDGRKDTPLYIDPRALRYIDNDWAQECVSLLQNFFDTVVQAMRDDNHSRAYQLLASLREPNETHLGFSRGRSRGRAIGDKLARDVWSSLSNSRAVESGLIEDLEDTVLFVPGIGFDIVSDITTNIIRGQLIQYTQESAEYHGIPMYDVASGQFWDRISRRWKQNLIPLPVAEDGPILLVPRAIVRRNQAFDPGDYFRHYVLPQLQDEEMKKAGSALIETLKNGQRRVTRETIVRHYGSGKRVNLDVTLRNPAILNQYREVKSVRQPAPSHQDLADLTESSVPDWGALLARVVEIPVGLDFATQYHHAIEALLTALFYPALDQPRREFRIHEGRKRIDIDYTNIATEGFFDWVNRVQLAPAPNLYVECKNYGRELGNPEVDQLAGRFSPYRGRVGLLIHRGFGDKDLLLRRCRDTSLDDRGFVLPMDDDDLRRLVAERRETPDSLQFALLRQRFDQLV